MTVLKQFRSLCMIGAMSISASAIAEKKLKKLPTQSLLNYAYAKQVVDTCVEQYAGVKNSNVVIAVVDRGGSLLAFRRMDGVAPGIVEAALQKARGAAAFGFPTREMRNWVLKNAAVAHLPDFSGLTGGIPLRTKNGELIGGVGVSGMHTDDDERCAQAGIDAIGNVL